MAHIDYERKARDISVKQVKDPSATLWSNIVGLTLFTRACETVYVYI